MKSYHNGYIWAHAQYSITIQSNVHDCMCTRTFEDQRPSVQFRKTTVLRVYSCLLQRQQTRHLRLINSHHVKIRTSHMRHYAKQYTQSVIVQTWTYTLLCNTLCTDTRQPTVSRVTKPCSWVLDSSQMKSNNLWRALQTYTCTCIMYVHYWVF